MSGVLCEFTGVVLASNVLLGGAILVYHVFLWHGNEKVNLVPLFCFQRSNFSLGMPLFLRENLRPNLEEPSLFAVEVAGTPRLLPTGFT